MAYFFDYQPREAYIYFQPHGFDVKSITQLQMNKYFLAYVLKEESSSRIAGYCFKRCFFMVGDIVVE